MPTLQTCDFNHPPPQLPTGLSAHSFPHDPTNFEVQLASVPTLQTCDFNHLTEKPVEDLLSATQDLMNIDNIIRFPSDIVSVLHQEEGGIGKSIPDAQDFPRPEGRGIS